MPVEWTIAGAAAAIAAGACSPVELTAACLARVERLDGRLRCFITVDAAGAQAAARALERELLAGRRRGPLHGIPLAYKDLCRVAGLPSSCGTRTADYFVSDGECTAVARLRAAGAVTLGTLNMSELALGPFGDNAHHGDVQNPWRSGHCAGGSSSGSAAAVAAGLVLGALGTDTGGSVRLPAACCGIAGLKPTYGRVSRAGIMPLSWSLDHLGPMARTVQDVALLLAAIAGHDPRDATSSRRSVPAGLGTLGGRAAGVRVGVPENYFFDGVGPEVETAVREVGRRLVDLGAAVVSLRVPDPAPIAEVSNILARCESAAIHARIVRERPHDLQPAVRARLEVGFRVSAHDYLQAGRLRSRLTRAFVTEVFREVDALLVPAIPEPAPRLDVVTVGSTEEIVRRMGRFARLTRPFNGLGLPALSVPCGLGRDGLPLAFQLVGRPFDEVTILELGHAWEVAARPLPSGPPLA